MAENELFYKWGGGMKPGYPRVERAEDEFLLTEGGDRLIDAASGAAVANLGHSVEGVSEVMAAQADEVGYLSLSHFSHGAPERLAGLVADRTPGDLDAVFYVTSGSEAVETAIKLARAYHHEAGSPEKTAVVSRWQSYHGATLGALSAGGNTGRRARYRPLLQNWPKVPPAYPYRWRYEGTPEEQARAAADDVERAIKQEGEDQVAAFVAEPVSGASIPAARPHPAYYEEVRRICDEHDVLFVADEVMTGFGRTGPLFACERYGVVPDMLALGKGLSAGYAPISATVVRDRIAAAFDHDAGGSFDHGHTYSGHPVAAAVAEHVVPKYTEDLLADAREAGRRLREGLAPLEDHPMVGEVRRAGLMLGIEFVADRGTKEPFDPGLNVNGRVYDEALDRGVYVYPGSGCVDGVAGDHCMLSPPLTVGEDSVDRIAEAVVESVEAVHEAVG